jgi:hypothetical protein
MSRLPGEGESELAKRLDALEAEAARRGAARGRFVSRVASLLVTAALILVLGWHGRDYFDNWRNVSGQTQELEANAGALAAAVEAKDLHMDTEPLQVQKMRVDVARLEAEAEKAKAEADAQSTLINDATMRLRLLQADIARTRAEADKAQAEADAQTQIINGISLAVAQKQAEVKKAEAEAETRIEDLKALMAPLKLVTTYGGDTYKSIEKILIMIYGGGASSDCSLYNTNGCDKKK